MTGLYEWNPMPHILDICCPSCRESAVFEFAEVVRIRNKDDVPFFQSSSQFEYQRLQDSCGHFWHGAFFFAGLHGAPSLALHDLPASYSASEWEHSKYLMRSHGAEIGSANCEHCGFRQRYTLNWPEDAYYVVSYKRKTLWAFNRESAVELLHYIGDELRDLTKYRWKSFLLHIPSAFKARGARNTVSKQLQTLLLPRVRNQRKNSS